jgi:hypothetical protein
MVAPTYFRTLAPNSDNNTIDNITNRVWTNLEAKCFRQAAFPVIYFVLHAHILFTNQAAEYGSGAPKINLCYNNCALATPFRPIFRTSTTRPHPRLFPFIRNDYIYILNYFNVKRIVQQCRNWSKNVGSKFELYVL